jgi:hypothetical protein
MPYICTDQNRYLGEHSCGRFHYGDQTIVRECCVADYREAKALRDRVAMTDYHPAARLEISAWNALTDAEQQIVRATL